MSLLTPKVPSLDSVTTINTDGSRYVLHPSDVKGRFTILRRLFALFLLALYVLLPWIKINGYPAVFLDVASRRFHLFGFTFVTQDLWLAFFFISGLGFSLFYLTALFGRLWCGWACPYTVFLEHVFRRIERLIDGDGPSRRKLDDAPWTSGKVIRRVIKHGMFLLAAAAIAHIFLSYFVSLDQLWKWMFHSPTHHFLAFGVVAFLTVVLYFCFSWFREQFCIILCPYGRIQSALTDDDSMIIGYDKARGEPRGKPNTPGVGDCINCLKCVQVCPTGIDIRNGLQMECIGCAACIDACDSVMARLQRPKGLVRYDSLHGFQKKRTRWIRPRIILYTVLLAAGVVALMAALTRLRPYQSSLTRMRGMPYFVNEMSVRNQFQIRLTNKQHEDMHFTYKLEDAPEGAVLTVPGGDQPVSGEKEVVNMLMVEVPRPLYAGPKPMKLVITSEPAKVETKLDFEFAGPDPKELASPKK